LHSHKFFVLSFSVFSNQKRYSGNRLLSSTRITTKFEETTIPDVVSSIIQQEGTIQLKEADIYEAKEPLKEEYLSQSGDIIVRLTAPYTAIFNSNHYKV